MMNDMAATDLASVTGSCLRQARHLLSSLCVLRPALRIVSASSRQSTNNLSIIYHNFLACALKNKYEITLKGSELLCMNNCMCLVFVGKELEIAIHKESFLCHLNNHVILFVN